MPLIRINTFARAIFWALPIWGILLSFRFIYIPYDFWTNTVQTVIRPGVEVCLWFEQEIHNLDWFRVIVVNMMIYYLAVLTIVFVVERFHRPSRT